MNSRPDQIDTAIQSALEVLTEKVIDSAINIDTGVMTLAEGQQYALDAQAQAHAAIKRLVLEERIAELKQAAAHNNSEYTSDYLEDRISNLEKEMEGMQPQEHEP